MDSLQSNQVKLPLKLHYWIDFLKIEAACSFKNAVMNWLFEY